LILLVYYSIG